MATINNISVPQKWHQFQLAGIEWLYNFRNRHPTLSLRTPEGCSLSRATSFNRHNVAMFFDNLEDVMSRHEAFGNGTRVYNLDETNTMTVQKSAKVLAVRGQKQVSKVTSAERGTLVTTCYIVNATGNTLPPVMIFPRVHFKSHMINGAPTGTLGLATQNGWMNGALFVQTMQHFINHTNSSRDNPSLLILDNHESHICIEALNLAKDNGVTVLTVPPHTTGKLQLLDVGVFCPFKVAYNKAVDSWLMRNAGKTFTIYDVAGCVKEAHMKAMTPNNICSGFKATGIFPYDRNIFTDDDFAPSNVTDRPPAKENELPESKLNHNLNIHNEYSDRTRTPSPSVLLRAGHLSPRIEDMFYNDDLELPILNDVQEEPMSSGLNSAPERGPQSKPELRKLSELASRVFKEYTGKTAKFTHSTCTSPPSMPNPPTTSTSKPMEPTPSISEGKPSKKSSLQPEVITPSTCRNTVESQKQFNSPFDFRGLPKAGPRKKGRTERRKGKSMIATDTPNKNEIEQRTEEKTKRQNRKTSAKAAKRKVLESDSEEEERTSLYSEEEPMLDEEDELIDLDPLHFSPLKTSPKEGNFILVEFEVLSRKIYYIAKVIGAQNADIEVSFLRKSVKNPNKFHVPNVPDITAVVLQDIKMILPQPGFTGSTKRTQGLYHFDIDFSKIDLR